MHILIDVATTNESHLLPSLQ